MRSIPFFLLLCSLAQADQYVPRINQISPRPEIIRGTPTIQDINGDNRLDLVFLPEPGSYPGGGVLLQNLGDRNFGNPKVTHLMQSRGLEFDSFPELIKLTTHSIPQIFFSRIEQVDDEYWFTPMTIALDTTNTIGIRSPINLIDLNPWAPVDLDLNGQTEFIQSIEKGTETELKIWDRQADGSYSSESITFAEEFYVDKASTADLDLDGDLDLIIHDGEEKTLLTRTGTREFSPITRYVELAYNDSLLTDLDGDGLLDFHSKDGDPFRWNKNLGGISFGPTQSRTINSNSSSDVILLKAETQSGAPALLHFSQEIDNVLHLSTIRFGTWETISEFQINTTGLARAVSIIPLILEDLDQDGKLDLLIGTESTYLNNEYGRRDYRLAVAWGTATGFGSAVYIDSPPIDSRNPLIADFDGNGSSDLLIGPDIDGHHWLLPNAGNGTFPNPVRLTHLSTPVGAPSGVYISKLHIGDIDGDSIIDLIIDYARRAGYGYQTACGIARGNGDGTFTTPNLPAGSFSVMVDCPCGIDHLVDWDFDGDLDAISDGMLRENLGGYFSNEIRPLISGITTTDLLGNPVTLTETQIGDVDGDGYPDIISLAYRTLETSHLIVGGSLIPTKTAIGIGYNDGRGGIASISEIPLTLVSSDVFGNPITSALTISDLNADGKNDICVKEYTSTDILGNPVTTSRWLRNPGGNSRNPASWITLPIGSGYTPFPDGPLLDFDGDGRLEWVLPTGYLRASPLGPVISATYDFTDRTQIGQSIPNGAADFDGDGDADFLFTQNGLTLTLLKNPLVDERSAITRFLVSHGVVGKDAGPGQDTDGDGRDNESELLLGTNPLLRDDAPINPLQVNLNLSSSSGALTYRVPQYASDLSLKYVVQRSTNLKNWTCIEDSSDLLFQQNGWTHLKLPVDRTEGSAYFRIHACHEKD